MKKGWLIIGIALVLTLSSSRLGYSQNQVFEKKVTRGGQKYVPGEIIVKFKTGVQEELIAKINARHKTSVLSTSRFLGFKRLKIPRGKTIAEMVDVYTQDHNVEYVEPNYIAYAHLIPDDSLYSYQWHMDNPEYGGINTEEAWDISTGNASVVVAVIDTGVAYEDYIDVGDPWWLTKQYYLAPDLANTSFVPGYDFVNGDSHPNDDEGHGTHVTGTIAQSTNNSMGVAGVAFSTSIMPVKVLNRFGTGSHADIADGIVWAADNGAHIINMSLGGPSGSTTLENAVAYAYNSGVTIVCSSGNDGSPDTIGFPAAYDQYCIAVGATRYDEAVAYYSNGGVSLDVVAPGGDITVDQNNDGYGDGVLQQTFSDSTNGMSYWFYQGTSMAAPHVSGVAALLIAHGVATTPDGVREALQSTAEDHGPVGWDSEYGWGIVDAYAALNYLTVPNNPPIANAGSDQSAFVGEVVVFDGSGSNDPDGSIVSYAWDFDDGSNGSGINSNHSYSAPGTYTVTLTVTDDGGLTDDDTTVITITEATSDIEVFFDNFEVGEWNGLWSEDFQNDWFRSTQRSIDGSYSAEVDGWAYDAKLTSTAIDLQGRTNASIRYSWYIEYFLDGGEYLAFDVSTDGGANWVEKARLRADIDPEGTWHNVTINLTDITSLMIRFRARMSRYNEDANVDTVRVIAH